MEDLAQLREIAETAMKIAEESLSQSLHLAGHIVTKGDRDFATSVDLAVEDSVTRYLRDATPHIPLLGEESGLQHGSSGPLQWVLDPIDGTVNFSHSSPLYSISLALADKGKPIIGVTYCPDLRELYIAAEGQGATLNGEPIQVSEPSHLSQTLVSLGDFAVNTDADQTNPERHRLMTELVPRVLRVRMLGSAAIDLAWLACGRTDAVVIARTNSWDVAAGAVIATEAGAAVTNRDGTPYNTNSTGIIGAHNQIHDALLASVNYAFGD